MERIALYTTVYPGMEPFCADWAASVARQTDTAFDLWIGVDGLDVAAVSAAAGRTLTAEYVHAEAGDSPATIRNRAIERMLPRYDAIIFVDSDDVLAPTRVESARGYLKSYDVAGTAMELIGPSGEPLHLSFSLPDDSDIAGFIFSRNAFGLSNSAYRCSILKNCLPVPASAVAVDWYLATMAFLNGGRIGFDPTPRMSYRQHGANTARILPPFTPEQVTGATRLVMGHQQSILDSGRCTASPLLERLLREQQRIAGFSRAVCYDEKMLQRYVAALNSRPTQTIWWACVAHPELEELWKQ